MVHAPAATLAPLEEALVAFRQQYPTFDTTRVLDELRITDYARLDTHNQVYLDYTVGGLYAERQLREYMELLSGNVFGNPHSTNPASQAMTVLVDRARRAVLDYFKASPEEYVVIFTPNATGALKLVGEAYPFAKDGQYLLTFDNHNSVNGIREFAQAKGANVTYVPLEPPDLRVNEVQLFSRLAQGRPGQHNLFAFPAQSNVSGVQHPLDWIAQAQAQGWDVLVDCAAFAPSNRLISPNGIQTSFLFRSIKSSAFQQAWAVCLHAKAPCANCAVPGLPVEQLPSPQSWPPMPPGWAFTWLLEKRGLKMAPSIICCCQPWRSACAILLRLGLT